jgi:hypothetical protein
VTLSPAPWVGCKLETKIHRTGLPGVIPGFSEGAGSLAIIDVFYWTPQGGCFRGCSSTHRLGHWVSTDPRSHWRIRIHPVCRYLDDRGTEEMVEAQSDRYRLAK